MTLSIFDSKAAISATFEFKFNWLENMTNTASLTFSKRSLTFFKTEGWLNFQSQASFDNIWFAICRYQSIILQIKTSIFFKCYPFTKSKAKIFVRRSFHKRRSIDFWQHCSMNKLPTLRIFWISFSWILETLDNVKPNFAEFNTTGPKSVILAFFAWISSASDMSHLPGSVNE